MRGSSCKEAWKQDYGSLVPKLPCSGTGVFFGGTFDWSLDDNASAHAPYHTPCVLRPLKRAC